MANFPRRYCRRRNAKLFAGPSDMTPSTKSRSIKYSLMVGMSNTGFLLTSKKQLNKKASDEREGHTCHVIIHLIYALIINFELPFMRTGYFKPSKVEHIGRGSPSGGYGSLVCCPMPVRRWWWRIYVPGLELLLYGFVRASNFWTYAHDIRNTLGNAVKHTVVVARVITESLIRGCHVLVMQLQAFAQLLEHVPEFGSLVWRHHGCPI